MLHTFRFHVGAVPVLKIHQEPRPAPAIVFLHGLAASKDKQLPELMSMAAAGLTAVGVDAPHHGAREDGWLARMEEATQPTTHELFLELLVEALEDVRRVVDHLLHEGHHPVRVAGISMGAYLALAAAAEDDRIHGCAALLGSPDWSPRHGPTTPRMGPLLSRAPVHRPQQLLRHPALLINAGLDENVPPRFSRAFVEDVRTRHGPLTSQLRYVEFPHSSHFMRPQDWMEAWRLTLGFLRDPTR